MRSTALSGTIFGSLLSLSGPVMAGELYGQISVGASVGGSTKLDATIVGLGSASASSDTETGIVVSGIVGKKLDSGIAVEAEVVHSSNDVDDSKFVPSFGGPVGIKVKTTGALINARYEHDTGTPLRPYIGVGVGVGQTDVEINNVSGNDTGVMYQVKAGVAYQVSEKVTIDVGYRYITTPEFEIRQGGNSFSTETDIHAITIGARFRFGE